MQLYKFTVNDSQGSLKEINQFLSDNNLQFSQVDWKVTSASYTDPMDTDDILHTQHVVWIMVE